MAGHGIPGNALTVESFGLEPRPRELPNGSKNSKKPIGSPSWGDGTGSAPPIRSPGPMNSIELSDLTPTCRRRPSKSSANLYARELGTARCGRERAIETGTPYEIDLEMVLPDGTTKWIVGRGEVESYVNGEPAQLRGTVQEITERKRSEQKLALSESRYRSLVRASCGGGLEYAG